jgi:hypothetical protein
MKDTTKFPITRKYTLEDWRTEEIAVFDIPDAVFETTFEDLLQICFGELVALDLNPVELMFSCIFLHKDWRILRTPLSQEHPVWESTAHGIRQHLGIYDALFGPGVPDFFIWNSEGRHRFVEVKATEDQLTSYQREWAETYDHNFVIAQLAPTSAELTEEEIREENRIS